MRTLKRENKIVPATKELGRKIIWNLSIKDIGFFLLKSYIFFPTLGKFCNKYGL